MLVRNLVTKVLKQNEYKVASAGDGVEALELFRAFDGRLDLILTDVYMPRMGGKQLEQNLRLLGFSVPVSFMTGWTSENSESCPIVPHTLFKPFRPAELVYHVERRLAQVSDRSGQWAIGKSQQTSHPQS